MKTTDAARSSYPAYSQATSKQASRTSTTSEEAVAVGRLRVGRDDAFCAGRMTLSPMKCPYCGHAQDRVVDSRESKEADSIRRRRECEACNKRFTTYERIDEIPYMVVKKDGRREKFDRQKLLSGLLHACEKRPVSALLLQQIVDEVESFVVDSPERERTTSEVGEKIMARLKDIDTVAYIRFASVYRDFKDVREFKAELEELLNGRPAQDARKRAVKI